MKVSLNTVRQLIDFDLPSTEELVKRINEQLGGVEAVIDLGVKYKDARIVKVHSVEQHPNADRLSVCLVDDGGSLRDITRTENGFIQVVCGAPNVHADMWAVWLPPQSTVPSSVDDPEPFVLNSRELRGVVSHGMLASGKELGINNDHEGIIELTEADLPPELEGRGLAMGQDFAEVFSLDDTILEIENKMFTHRPDCFGQLGVAREIAGILGQPFMSPDWYGNVPSFLEVNELEIDLYNEAQDKVPRLLAVAMTNVSVGSSPLWLQTTLIRWGSKPINNIVDITNYIMLFSAQPTHAYDYDKLRGGKLGARMAQDGEKITLLNGKTYNLTSEDIVMADADGPVGVAGIMGGIDSEVSAETKRIVLEVATFDMYAVRKTAMRHGIFTDALTRFNKGQSPLQNDRIIDILMQYMHIYFQATQASNVLEINTSHEVMKQRVEVSAGFINERLGTNLTEHDMATLLGNVEIATSSSSMQESSMYVEPPFWRTDLETPEDIVEEVGRLHGFDSLPRVLPLRSSVPAPKNKRRELKQRVRQILSRAGANEVLTYSFVHEQIMMRAEQDSTEAFKLSNALSPELQYYRLSVLPSLLEKVHGNIKMGFDEFVLFEIGKAHNKHSHADDDEGLPRELEMIDAVYTSKKPQNGAAYYYMRRLVAYLVDSLGIEIVFKPITDALDYPLTAPFQLDRSALVESRQGEFIGIIGEMKPTVRKRFKLPDYVSAMSLDFEGLLAASMASSRQYSPLSRFPSTSQDISLKTDTAVPYDRLASLVWSSTAELADGMNIQIEPVGIYQPKDEASSKTTTFHITFTDYERTLTDDQINPIMDHIATEAETALRAERV